MFAVAIPVWEILIRTVVVYLVIFAGLRLMGKREMGQMTVLDLVAILLVANAVQNAMVGPDVSLAGGVIAGLTLLAVNAGLSALRLRGGLWGRLLEDAHGAGGGRRVHPAAPAQGGPGAQRGGDGDAGTRDRFGAGRETRRPRDRRLDQHRAAGRPGRAHPETHPAVPQALSDGERELFGAG